MSGTITTGWRIDSRREVYDPIEWVMSENGTQHGVSLGDGRRNRWRLSRIMTEAEKATLLALFDTNQSTSGNGNTAFSFDDEQDSPATTYSAEFLSRPVFTELAAGTYLAQVEAIEIG